MLHFIRRLSILKQIVPALQLVFITNSLLAVDTDTLFKSDEIINIELRSDFSAIQLDRVDKPQYHQGEVIYQSPDGKIVKLSVKVMARGDFRRDPENCYFSAIVPEF